MQVTKQNKELKRQSQMLLQKAGLKITEINIDQLDQPNSNDDVLQQEYIKTLDDKIQSKGGGRERESHWFIDVLFV